MDESAERFFLGYALTVGCGGNEDERKKLRARYDSGDVISQNEIGVRYPGAIKRMRDYGLNFTLDGVRDYWWVYHNKTAPDNCHVKFGRVERIGDAVEFRRKDGTLERAINVYNLGLKVGAYVSSHAGQVVREMTEREYQTYG